MRGAKRGFTGFPQFILFTLVGLWMIFCLSASAAIGNRLFPFQTDGCSRFPDGSGAVSWRVCCVEHDIAYWAGGSAEQRKEADLELRDCVSARAGSALGDLMYFGVRIGGYTGLPTAWHWGYGWAVYRGYAPLSAEERRLVADLKREIPADRARIPLVNTPMIPERPFAYGDYCMDLALAEAQAHLGRPFSLVGVVEEVRAEVDGWRKILTLQVEGCGQPFRFDFLLLRRHACTEPVNELLARGRIRLLRVWPGRDCRAD